MKLAGLEEIVDKFEYAKINHDLSLSYLIKISDNPGSMPRHVDLNLKLFKLAMASGETKKIIYIIDRWLSGDVRGKGLGRELLKIIDQVAKANGCELVFGLLVPEKDEDEKRLVASHKKAGYKVFENEEGKPYSAKMPMAVKNYK